MVPKTQSSMLAIMLIYIVVGLALTTMCIDLVGLQYIEKIHYLGQKLKRPQINLSSMLKKRKQLELNIINMNKMRRQALCDNDRRLISSHDISFQIFQISYFCRTPTISEPRSEPTSKLNQIITKN